MILKDLHFDQLEPNPNITKADTVIETLQEFKISPQTHANQITSDKQQNKKFQGRDMTTKQTAIPEWTLDLKKQGV